MGTHSLQTITRVLQTPTTATGMTPDTTPADLHVMTNRYTLKTGDDKHGDEERTTEGSVCDP